MFSLLSFPSFGRGVRHNALSGKGLREQTEQKGGKCGEYSSSGRMNSAW